MLHEKKLCKLEVQVNLDPLLGSSQEYTKPQETGQQLNLFEKKIAQTPLHK